MTMRFLYRYGRLIEWMSAIIIATTVLFANLGIFTNRGAMIVAGIFFCVYWASILPRIIHEHK